MARQLRVLVVDDTLTSRQLLVHIVNHSGDMTVVAEGSNGEQALQLTRETRPDIVLMDIMMPRMDGLEATQHIMQQNPVPIVLITASLDTRETDVAFRAMKAGALTVLQKPEGMKPADVSHLRTTLRAMADVSVIHHFQRTGTEPKADATISKLARSTSTEIRLVAIASSTGGPAALADIFSKLAPDFAAPVVVAQHISPDFVTSLSQWLDTITPLHVRIAEAGKYPEVGNIYFAPGDTHLSIGMDGRLHLSKIKGTWRYMPSCDVLLHSVAQTYGKHALGVVLTGMGDDGADGLRAMYEQEAITIAQDEATSVVYGMPQEAVLRGGVQQVLPIDKIAEALNKVVGTKERS